MKSEFFDTEHKYGWEKSSEEDRRVNVIDEARDRRLAFQELRFHDRGPVKVDNLVD